MLSVLNCVMAMQTVRSNVEMIFTNARIPVHVEETARLAVKVVSPGIVIVEILNQVPSIWNARNGLNFSFFCVIQLSF